MNVSTNILLANLIRLFHIIIILFVFIIPFSNIPSLLILHITFSLSLLLHWYTNSNECSLTLLESKLRGIDRNAGFTHKFIAPIYDISLTKWSSICYIIIIILISISIYKLYNSKKLHNAIKSYKQNKGFFIKDLFEIN